MQIGPLQEKNCPCNNVQQKQRHYKCYVDSISIPWLLLLLSAGQRLFLIILSATDLTRVRYKPKFKYNAKKRSPLSRLSGARVYERGVSGRWRKAIQLCMLCEGKYRNFPVAL